LFFIFNPVLTEVKTDGPVFRQDIIQGDTLKGSDWDAGGGGGEGGVVIPAQHWFLLEKRKMDGH
jgi:hypothetical protein